MKKENIQRAVKIALYFLLPVAVLVLGIAGKDKWYFIATSVVAIVYLLLLSDGKRVAYLLCAVYGLGHGAASFAAGLYAGAVYHAAILAPIGLYRFITAGKEQNTVVRSLAVWQWAVCVLCLGATTTGLYFALRALHGAQPLMDALTLAFSVVTAFLLLRNYKEMWLFNLFSSLLFVVLWTVQYMQNGTGLAVVALQTIVSVINVIGFVNWLRRSKNVV